MPDDLTTYEFSTDRDRLDADWVHRQLAENAYWVLGRPRDVHDVAVVEDLEPLGLRRTVLATADAHGLYEKYGFGPLREPVKWMERPA